MGFIYMDCHTRLKENKLENSNWENRQFKRGITVHKR